MVNATSMREILRRLKFVFWVWPLLAGIVGCDKDGPEPPPLGRICTWDVPKGESYTFKEATGGPASVDFIARVYEASLDTSCKKFDDKLHPLVIVAHGRVAANVPTNYLGMTFLTDHLASWGDIVVSINLDVVNALQGKESQWGIPHRGELVLHAIEYMLAENRRPGSRFFQHIDSTKIALVGHSRGGGAVIYAANANALRAQRPIKAIATLSPANFGTQPLQTAVPHICLYGTWDGDLYEGQGPDIWSHGTREASRELVEIYGANHYFFTDHATFAPESSEISRESHHVLANGMVNAWFDRYLRGNDRYGWSRYLTGSVRLKNGLEYYTTYQDAEFVPLTHEPGADSERAMMGASTQVVSKGLCVLCDVDLSGKPNYDAGTGKKASWDTRNDQLEYAFPAIDVSEYYYLSFRVSQVHGDSLNIVDFKKDFHVLVSDASGVSAKVRVSDYISGLQYPDLSGSLPPEDPNNRKQIMRGYRIPKADLKGVDFSQVVAVKFIFDRPASKGYDNVTGSIKVADLEFSN